MTSKRKLSPRQVRIAKIALGAVVLVGLAFWQLVSPSNGYGLPIPMEAYAVKVDHGSYGFDTNLTFRLPPFRSVDAWLTLMRSHSDSWRDHVDYDDRTGEYEYARCGECIESSN